MVVALGSCRGRRSCSSSIVICICHYQPSYKIKERAAWALTNHSTRPPGSGHLFPTAPGRRRVNSGVRRRIPLSSFSATCSCCFGHASVPHAHFQHQRQLRSRKSQTPRFLSRFTNRQFQAWFFGSRYFSLRNAAPNKSFNSTAGVGPFHFQPLPAGGELIPVLGVNHELRLRLDRH